jgi:hypothetical protein
LTRKIGYGELYGVEIPDEVRTVQALLSPCENDLIELIRDGQQELSVLHVHQSQPALAELDYVEKGFRCRKKVKFPTA